MQVIKQTNVTQSSKQRREGRAVVKSGARTDNSSMGRGLAVSFVEEVAGTPLWSRLSCGLVGTILPDLQIFQSILEIQIYT